MLMKVHRPSLENTDYLLLRGADTIFLSDESLGQFSYNSYLMQSTAQIVLPGATYTQLLALALWLEEKKRIPCATRIIFLAGNQDCQRVLKGSQVPPREEIDLMVQEIWDLFEGPIILARQRLYILLPQKDIPLNRCDDPRRWEAAKTFHNIFIRTALQLQERVPRKELYPKQSAITPIFPKDSFNRSTADGQIRAAQLPMYMAQVEAEIRYYEGEVPTFVFSLYACYNLYVMGRLVEELLLSGPLPDERRAVDTVEQGYLGGGLAPRRMPGDFMKSEPREVRSLLSSNQNRTDLTLKMDKELPYRQPVGGIPRLPLFEILPVATAVFYIIEPPLQGVAGTVLAAARKLYKELPAGEFSTVFFSRQLRAL
jgi:hypothetical protein